MYWGRTDKTNVLLIEHVMSQIKELQLLNSFLWLGVKTHKIIQFHHFGFHLPSSCPRHWETGKDRDRWQDTQVSYPVTKLESQINPMLMSRAKVQLWLLCLLLGWLKTANHPLTSMFVGEINHQHTTHDQSIPSTCWTPFCLFQTKQCVSCKLWFMAAGDSLRFTHRSLLKT